MSIHDIKIQTFLYKYTSAWRAKYVGHGPAYTDYINDV